ncbi:MAG: dTDP-4-dehydrorhamnose reductase [Prosthecobacter sp.]|nr:dTDP-4-dehydrorhamnose reductase [Prosthecobacter sp.]
MQAAVVPPGVRMMNMKTKVLILGSTGRLGGALRRHYGARHELLCPARHDINLGEPASLNDALRRLDFDILVNCAGITSPDACEREPALAARINHESPVIMAGECQRRGARMIQISTDYVFGGEGREPLDEDAAADPVNVYGRTKRDAETGVLAACPSALVARVSWLFGSGGAFADQVLRDLREGREVQAIEDKWSVPTSVDSVARWLEALWSPGTSGLIHLCNSGSATWRSYGQEVVDQSFGLGLLQHRPEVRGNSLDDFPHFAARRPRFTVMSNARLAGLLGCEVPAWQEDLGRWLRSLRA